MVKYIYIVTTGYGCNEKYFGTKQRAQKYIDYTNEDYKKRGDSIPNSNGAGYPGGRVTLKAYLLDGEEIDLDDYSGLQINCFKCEERLNSFGAVLISPPEYTSSDGVSKTTKIHICVKCYNDTLDFMLGKIGEIFIPNKISLIKHALLNDNVSGALAQIDDLQTELKHSILKQ